MSEEGSQKAEEEVEVEPKIILTQEMIEEGLSQIYRVPGKCHTQPILYYPSRITSPHHDHHPNRFFTSRL
jgi:hypothetical protein